jgi:hypothetical protein
MDSNKGYPYPWMDLKSPIRIHPGGWISMDGGYSSIHSELCGDETLMRDARNEQAENGSSLMKS